MNKLKIILSMTGPHPARRVGESSSFQSGFTMVELLVSLGLFATIMAMLVGLNSLPGQTSASRETEARNQVQDGVRTVMAELTTGLRQAGGERNKNGAAAVNCLPNYDSSWVPCLVVALEDPNDQESATNLLGFRFFNVQGGKLDNGEREGECEHVWYEYIPSEKEITQKRITAPQFIGFVAEDAQIMDPIPRSINVCSGINKDDGYDGPGGTLDDDDDPELDPSGANPLLSNVLGFKVTVLCRNVDPNIRGVVEAIYPDNDNDPRTYEAPQCYNPNTNNLDPAWYPATAIVSIFAASEAENVESSNQTGRIDQTGFRNKLDKNAPADSPRCVEVPDYHNPPDNVDICPLGQVCYCLEERVELSNFRHVNFP